MPSMIYNSAKADLLSGAINLTKDTWKVMLVGSGYKPDATHSRRSDITDEVSGAGYAPGGRVLTGLRVVQNDRDNEGQFHADDAIWPGATITAYGAVVYKSRGGSPANDELLCYFGFKEVKISSGGSFQVEWSSGGVMAVV